MKSIDQLPRLKGERVLIRVDYNVPLKGNRILDTRRIDNSFKTIDKVMKQGGTPVLIAHLADSKMTLKPIYRYLSKKYKVLFLSDSLKKMIKEEVLENIQKETVVLLENVRKNKGEEKNEARFAKDLASLGSYYINDAFSVSHRAHASIVGIPKLLPSFAGYQLMIEVQELAKVTREKIKPFLFILGGAKFSTKIPLLKKFSNIADQVVIAGAIMNDFYKVAGLEVGKSVVGKGNNSEIRNLLKNPKILLPTDVLVKRGEKNISISVSDVQKSDKIVDVGSDSLDLICQKIKKAKIVVWNGPTGWYEGGYTRGTISLAKALLASNAIGVIGGGDTGAVLDKFISRSNKKKKIFVSSGGGATLDFLTEGTLPGIKALD